MQDEFCVVIRLLLEGATPGTAEASSPFNSWRTSLTRNVRSSGFDFALNDPRVPAICSAMDA